jgi:peptidoglycan hydrolase-like protein with peptidoglycan-binding domain
VALPALIPNSRGLLVVGAAVAATAVALAVIPTRTSAGAGQAATATITGSGPTTTQKSTSTTLPAATTTTVARPTLSNGSKGADVTLLQQRLTALGFAVGTADGVFGTATTNAVKQLQTSKGLTADGVVNTATWTALLAGS